MNKKSLIIIGIVLAILCVIGLLQLALIALGVLALIYALNLIKSDYAFNGPDENDEIKLDLINNEENENDEHDKEIKDNSKYMKKKNKGKRPNEVEKVLKGFKLTTLEKAVIITFTIFALIMIAFIVILSLKKNDTPFEVDTKDELVMTDEEREANKKKKEETEKALKEAEEKEEEERLKAEEEKEEAEKEKLEEKEIESETETETETKPTSDEKAPIDDSIQVSKDTQETTNEVKNDIYQQ